MDEKIISQRDVYFIESVELSVNRSILSCISFSVFSLQRWCLFNMYGWNWIWHHRYTSHYLVIKWIRFFCGDFYFERESWGEIREKYLNKDFRFCNNERRFVWGNK